MTFYNIKQFFDLFDSREVFFYAKAFLIFSILGIKIYAVLQRASLHFVASAIQDSGIEPENPAILNPVKQFSWVAIICLVVYVSRSLHTIIICNS